VKVAAIVIILAASSAAYFLLQPVAPGASGPKVVGQSVNETIQTAKVETSSYITEYQITPNSEPNAIAMDAHGNLWFTLAGSAALAELTPSNGTVHVFRLPEAKNATLGSWGVLVDGAHERVWFTDQFSNSVWSFSIPTRVFTEYHLANPYSTPYQIAEDKGGNVWFTETDSDRIGEIFANGTLREYQVPLGQDYNLASRSVGPAGIAIDPQGTVWFTEVYANSIGSFSNGRFQQYNLNGEVSFPNGIAVGPDGEIWITQHGPSFISEFNPKTGSLRTISTSVVNVTATLPYFVQVDGNGNVWFDEHYGNAIAEFVASNNSLIEYRIPSGVPDLGNLSGSFTITLSPSGQPWFTEFYTGKIGTVDLGKTLPLSIQILNSTSQGVYTLGGKGVSLVVSVSSETAVSLTSSIGGSGANLTLEFSPSSGSGTFASTLSINEKGTLGNSYTVTISAITKGLVVSKVINVEA
jgi:streptogramin lyase